MITILEQTWSMTKNKGKIISRDAGSWRARFGEGVNGRQRSARQFRNMVGAFRIASDRGLGSSITVQRLRLSVQLGIQIASGELKQRIRGIFFHQRPDDFQRALILLIVVVQIDGEVKARFRRRENS